MTDLADTPTTASLKFSMRNLFASRWSHAAVLRAKSVLDVESLMTTS